MKSETLVHIVPCIYAEKLLVLQKSTILVSRDCGMFEACTIAFHCMGALLTGNTVSTARVKDNTVQGARHNSVFLVVAMTLDRSNRR